MGARRTVNEGAGPGTCTARRSRARWAHPYCLSLMLYDAPARKFTRGVCFFLRLSPAQCVRLTAPIAVFSARSKVTESSLTVTALSA